MNFLWHDGTQVEMTLAPDGFVGIEDRTGHREYFFVEIDRGNEPIQRRDSKQSSIEKKFRAYAALEKSKRLSNFRMRTLFVTTSAKRVESMIEAVSTGMNKRSFLFATLYEFSQMPGASCWRDGKGNSKALVTHAFGDRVYSTE